MKRKLVFFLMFWLEVLHAVSQFFQLLCFMVQYHVQKKSLRATYLHDFIQGYGTSPLI
jgi:hypothetical protein